MLLSEENERLRAELERMKSLAASLLGAPAIREPQTEPVRFGRQISGSQLMPSSQEPSNSFQLSLSQPTVSDFGGLRSNMTSFKNSTPATVSLGAFPTLSRAGSGLHGGNFFSQGLQATTSQRNGIIDFPVVLSGGGQPQRQQPVLGSSAYSLENLQAFAGDIRSSPIQKTQAMLPLLPVGSLGGGLPQLADAAPHRKDDMFVYPGISHIEKKHSDHFKPFSSHRGGDIPLAPLPTAQLAAKEESFPEGGAQGYASHPHEAGKRGYASHPAAEGKDDNEEPKQRGSRKRDRDSSEENRKMRLSKDQSQQLEAAFNEQSTHSPKQKNALALRLGLRPRQVEVWFQNRRARTKLKQTEIDCEVLKRCCETLTEENRRLQKEVIALKSRQPASSGDDRRGFGADAAAPVCVKCKEQIATVESSALHIQLADGGLGFDKQESGLDSDQHTVSVS